MAGIEEIIPFDIAKLFCFVPNKSNTYSQCNPEQGYTFLISLTSMDLGVTLSIILVTFLS